MLRIANSGHLMSKPPPRPPWRVIVLLLVLIAAMIVVAVTMWPGLRKTHRIEKVSSSPSAHTD
jgi:hypothetical protein